MRNKKIVIFEEFESIRKILKKSLESKDFEVIEINSIDQFEGIFNGLGYVAVIIDNDNRNNVADEVMKKLRDMTHYLYTPIILLITGQKESFTDKYGHYNVACYLTKPFDMNHFYSVIQRLT
jgi:DNA-binding response OmpR family regulator